MPEHDDRLSQNRHAGRLVGRDSEMERIHAFLAAARTDGGALLVTGEPGVGKTVLLDAASEVASAAGTQILRSAGVEFEAETSFSGLNQLLLPHLDALPQLQAVHRDALNVALGFSEGTPPTRLVVSNAALMLLRQTATARPVLVILDDLPWLDRASTGVLSFVARRLAGSQVGLIGASRTGEVYFFDQAGLPELEVPRLHDVAAGQLLDSRFPELVSAVRERILVEAQGNPLALLELPVALSPEMRASATAMPFALPLSRRLQALFGSRITELPPPTRQLLLHMALDGTGDLRVLGVGTGRNAGLHDLAPAERARLAYLDERTHRTPDLAGVDHLARFRFRRGCGGRAEAPPVPRRAARVARFRFKKAAAAGPLHAPVTEHGSRSRPTSEAVRTGEGVCGRAGGRATVRSRR